MSCTEDPPQRPDLQTLRADELIARFNLPVIFHFAVVFRDN